MTDNAIQTYLAGVPAEFRPIVTRLHNLALSQMPNAYAMIDHGTLAYSISPTASGLIVYVAPQPRWVNLGFYFGVGLPDPANLLVGKGSRLRHVKIASEQDAENPGLAGLLRAAWEKAPEDFKQLHESRQKKQ